MLEICMSIAITILLAVIGSLYLRNYFTTHEVSVKKKEFKIMTAVVIALAAGLAVLSCLSAITREIETLNIAKRVTLITGLLICAVSDVKIKLIPNVVVLCMIALWLLESAIGWVFLATDIVADIISSLIGALLGGGLLFIGRLVSRNGMGMGDIKLMFAAGLYTKFDGMFGVLFWGLLLALVFGVVLIALKKAKMKTTISMAPFFLLGATVTDLILLVT